MHRAPGWLRFELAAAAQPRYRDTALADTKTIFKHRAILAGVTVLTLAASIIAPIGTHLSIAEKVLLAIVGTGVGTVVVLGPLVFLAGLALAPHRQRNEARTQLVRLTAAEDDPQVLLEEFSTWLLAKKAATPAPGGGWQPLFPLPGMSTDTHARIAQDHANQRLAAADRLAQVRGEYHERFRSQILALLPGSARASDPQTLADLDAVGAALRAHVDPDTDGTPIPEGHRELLHRLLELAITAVEHDVTIAYAEDTATGETHREAFAAHFPGLATRLAAWDASVISLGRAESALGHRILQEASARGLCEEPYLAEPVVNVLRRRTLGSIDDHHEVSPQLQEKCFEGSVEIDKTQIALIPKGAEEDREEYRERVQEAVEQVRAFLLEIQGWDEKRAVAKAHGEHLVLMDKEGLRGELRKLGKIETIYRSRACPICRVNAGELD